MILTKAQTNPEIDRIARSLEPRARRAFLDAIERLRGQVDIRALERAVATGSLRLIQEALGMERLPRELAPMGDVILDAVRQAGVSEAVALQATLGISIRFDIVSPRAIDFIRNHGGILIREVAEETRRGVIRAVERGFAEGFAPPRMARLIRDQVGLTTHQAEIVANYRAALQRAIRGEVSYDSLVRRFTLNPVRGPGGLVEARLESAVEQYQARLLRHRADMIARTETLRAANMGQQALWMQLLESGALPHTQQKEWMTAEDEKVCPICAPLDGVRVHVADQFPTGLTPPAHPSCRCTMVLVFT